MLGFPWERLASPVAESELGISDLAPRRQGHKEERALFLAITQLRSTDGWVLSPTPLAGRLQPIG